LDGEGALADAVDRLLALLVQRGVVSVE